MKSAGALEMISIPHALSGCRFIRVASLSKRAIDPSWQDFNNYAYDDVQIVNHIESGANYGVLPSSGIGILDIDNPAEAKKLEILAYFSKTFTVKTSKGYHFYFKLNGEISPDKIALSHPTKKNEKGQPLQVADLFLPGCRGYTVGPGSHHQSGSTYEVVNDVPLMEITVKDLEYHLLSKVHYPKKQDPIVKPLRPGPITASSLTDALNLRVIDIMPPVMEKGSTRTGAEEKGSHPIHGSTSGSNYSVNLQKNQWYCHRCHSGGGPLEALAVREGLISCEQAGHVEIKGELFKKLKTILAETEGYGKQIAELDEEYKKTKPSAHRHLNLWIEMMQFNSCIF
nr:bifunctional DNA primase/polymerase [uncultured Methanospirillum sp.]